MISSTNLFIPRFPALLSDLLLFFRNLLSFCARKPAMLLMLSKAQGSRPLFSSMLKMHSDYWFYLQVDSTLEEDRRQKHVSFDSSSLMRSQTLATMDEASFQRMAAAIASQNMASSPSKSSERLIDGRKTPDLELYSQIFPPDLARQIMMGKATFVIFFSPFPRDLDPYWCVTM